jgi:pimeloyl-ACP methyl ester carboxylesterase
LPGDGIRMHALDWGFRDAPRLALLLHGVAGNAHIWDAAARRLRERLGDAAHVVALDSRDGGLTDHPATGYEPEDFGNDLASAHDALGRKPLTLVGHSRGGWIAAWFAERYKDRVERLILVDPARLSFQRQEASDGFFDRIRLGLGRFATEQAAIDWGRQWDPDGDWNKHRIAGFLANYRRQEDGSLVGHVPPATVEQLRRRSGEDPVGPRLREISCPTLLLVGTRQSADRQRDKLLYAESIPNCRVVKLAAGHFLHTDLPDEVAREIANFVTF